MIATHTRPVTPNMVPRVNPNKNVIMARPPQHNLRNLLHIRSYPSCCTGYRNRLVSHSRCSTLFRRLGILVYIFPFSPPHALFPLHILYSNSLQTPLFCKENTSNLHSRFPCHYISYSFPVPRLGIALFLPCSALLMQFRKWFPSHNACPINFIFTIYPILSQCPLLTMQKSSSVMDLFLDPLCPHFKTIDNFHFSISPSSGVGFSNSSAASF